MTRGTDTCRTETVTTTQDERLGGDTWSVSRSVEYTWSRKSGEFYDVPKHLFLGFGDSPEGSSVSRMYYLGPKFMSREIKVTGVRQYNVQREKVRKVMTLRYYVFYV